jgi:hypothetical protein
MTDESTSYFQRWHALFKKRDRTFVHYYHYVVATAPSQTAPPSDRLMVTAFEDTCAPNSPLWKRADTKDRLCVQCDRARPLYDLAKAREEARQPALENKE